MPWRDPLPCCRELVATDTTVSRVSGHPGGSSTVTGLLPTVRQQRDLRHDIVQAMTELRRRWRHRVPAAGVRFWLPVVQARDSLR